MAHILKVRMPFLSLNQQRQSTEGTQSTDHNQWPDFIISSYTNELPR